MDEGCPELGRQKEGVAYTIASDGSDALPIIDERLELLRLIGKGANSRVYLAKHRLLDTFVAVKILDLIQADAEQALKRFHNEAELLNSFNHKNVVKFLSFGKSPEGLPYMVLEYLEGKTLAQILESGAISPTRAQEIFEQVCLGLSYAHERGVIHRDIKPSNLMIVNQDDDGDEIVKILDFGTFRRDDASVQQQLTQQGTLIGTPNYMSPEQCRGEKADPRSDIYSLGCVMYEALCGAPPMMAESDYAIMNNHLNTMLTQVKSKAPISRQFEDVLIKCMKKDPSERYSSAAELSQALESVQPEGSFRVSKKVLLSLAVVVVLIAGFYFLKQLVQEQERAKRIAIEVAEKKGLQGRSYSKLELANPATTKEAMRGNMHLMYQWLQDNHSYLLHHYSKDIQTPDEVVSQISIAYRDMTVLRNALGDIGFGDDLKKDMEAELWQKISILKKSDYSDSVFLNKERRNIYHYYRILLRMAVADLDFKKAEMIMADAASTKGNAELKNEFLAESYHLLIAASIIRGYNAQALAYSQKLDLVADRIVEPSAKYNADITIGDVYRRQKMDAAARQRYERAAQLLRSERDGRLQVYARSLRMLSDTAPALNALGLQKYTIEFLSPTELWVGKNPHEAPWLVARALLAQAFIRDGQLNEANKIYKQIVPIAQTDAASGPPVLVLIAVDRLAYAVEHENDVDLQKTAQEVTRLITVPNQGEFMRALDAEIGNKPEDDEKFDRLSKALLNSNDKELRFNVALTMGSRAHSLRGLGRTDEAIAEYESAVKEIAKQKDYYHGSIVLQYGIALCYFAKGDLKKVEQVLEKAYAQDALRKEPNAEHYLLDHALFEFFMRKGDIPSARKLSHKDVIELEQLIETDRKAAKPETWKVLYLTQRGANYLSTYLGDPDVSKADLEVDRLLRKVSDSLNFVGQPSSDDSNFVGGISNLYAVCAQLKRKVGKTKEALDLFKRAYELLPARDEFMSQRDSLRKELGLP